MSLFLIVKCDGHVDIVVSLWGCHHELTYVTYNLPLNNFIRSWSHTEGNVDILRSWWDCHHELTYVTYDLPLNNFIRSWSHGDGTITLGYPIFIQLS